MRRLSVPTDPAQVYRSGSAVWTYVAWATKGAATVDLAVRTPTARVVDKYGNERLVSASGGIVRVILEQKPRFNEPVYVVEVPPDSIARSNAA